MKKWLKRIFLTSLILLVSGTGFVVYFYLQHDMGEGPAGPAVSQEAFATVWTDRPVLLLGLGDSITTGFGASPGKSYVQRLVKNPADEFADMQGRSLELVLPNLTVKNISVNATTSIDHERNQIPSLEKQSKETLGIILMTTGGNDLIHMYGRVPPAEGAMYGATLAQAEPWIANFETRLQGMLEDINSTFPGGCHIFLANIYDPSDGVGSFAPVMLPAWPEGLKVHAAMNAAIERCASTYDYVHLVNIHEPLLGHGIYSRQFWRDNYKSDDPHYWYYDNLEDPNDRGYDAIRRIMLNEIIGVMSVDKAVTSE